MKGNKNAEIQGAKAPHSSKPQKAYPTGEFIVVA